MYLPTMLFLRLYLVLFIMRWPDRASAFTPHGIGSSSGLRSQARAIKQEDPLQHRVLCSSSLCKFSRPQGRFIALSLQSSPSSSASLAASAGIGASGVRFPWKSAAVSAALFSLASLMPAKEYPGGSAASELALAMDDGEEPAQAILVKSLRVAGTAAFLYFAKEYAEYYKQSEIAAVLAKEKMYKAEMYFDAVKDILTRLQNPRLRPSVAGDLKAQLEQLDPHGRIQKFYATGADPRKKPDISDIVEANSRRHRGESVENTRRMPESSANEQSKTKTPISSATTSVAPIAPSPAVSSGSVQPDGVDADVRLLVQQLSEQLRAYGFDDFAVKSAIKSLEAPLTKLDRYAKLLALEKIRSQLGNEKYWAKYVSNVIAQRTDVK